MTGAEVSSRQSPPHQGTAAQSDERGGDISLLCVRKAPSNVFAALLSPTKQSQSRDMSLCAHLPSFILISLHFLLISCPTIMVVPPATRLPPIDAPTLCYSLDLPCLPPLHSPDQARSVLRTMEPRIVNRRPPTNDIFWWPNGQARSQPPRPTRWITQTLPFNPRGSEMVKKRQEFARADVRANRHKGRPRNRRLSFSQAQLATVRLQKWFTMSIATSEGFETKQRHQTNGLLTPPLSDTP